MTRNHGSVTAFVVTVTSSLMLLVGLVHDGGRLVAAHLRVSDVAAAAARAGAQQVVGIRAGRLEVDPAAAVDWRSDPEAIEIAQRTLGDWAR